MAPERPPTLTIDEVLERFDGLLIDAYGVLVHATGAFAGAGAFVERLDRQGVPFVVVTNDASRLPETCADKYASHGVRVDPSRIITSGSLLDAYYAEHDLAGARTLVLGTPDSHTYAERAGAKVVDPAAFARGGGDFEVLVIGDESGFDFLPTIDEAITTIFRRIEGGRPPRLVLPNPDMLYQRSEDAFGIASGMVAHLIERAIRQRYPGADLHFDRLGKPHPPMYEVARDQLGCEQVAMLGDQLDTDIRGAVDAGIDAVLVTGGVSDLDYALAHSDVRPDWVLESLRTG